MITTTAMDTMTFKQGSDDQRKILAKLSAPSLTDTADTAVQSPQQHGESAGAESVCVSCDSVPIVCPWLDRYQIGKKYTYREDGAECIARVLDKSAKESRGGLYIEIELECVRSIHGGRFGEIESGSKWTAGALMEPGGYPNAYAGWSLREDRLG